MKNVFITGADRGIGFAMCQAFLENGWFVFAGQFMPEWKELDGLKKGKPNQLSVIPLNVADTDSVKEAARLTAKQTNTIDILISCAGIGIGDSPKEVLATFQVNTLGSLRMVEEFLPLMRNGMKRLCFVSSEAGSITLAHRKDSFSYCMSKTALNMSVRLMFNELSGKGYTFRLYHPGWVRSYMEGEKSTIGNFEPEETAVVAYDQFTEARDCENVLMMTDVSNELWPF